MNEERPVEVEKVTVHSKGQNNQTLGTVSLVTGILGLVLYFCCFGIDLVLGLVALVTGIMALKEDQNLAMAGMILGIIVVVLNIMSLAGCIGLSLLSLI